MLGKLFRYAFPFLLLLLPNRHALALDVPERPEGYVTDQAGLLSPAGRMRLEQILAAYEAETTNQVVVATFPSLEGESLEDFSIRLAEQWKVGQKDRDNGVILLVFKDDRKMRIEVGYGLEGALPDALSGQIVNQVIAPHFREEQYESGILAGVAAITQATQGEFQAARARGSYGAYAGSYQRSLMPAELEALRAQGKAAFIFILIAVAIFFVIDFFRYRGYLKDHRLYRDRYSFWGWWFRFALLLFVLNLLFRIMFYTMLFSRGGYYGGRGGFGGFSGGRGGFGGGGASGRW